MQGHECSKGMSLRRDYRILGQGRWGMGMEQGRLGRVGHMEFQEMEQRVKVRMENRKVMGTKLGSWKQK